MSFMRQISKCNIKLSSFSAVRFYSVCNEPFDCVNVNVNSSENSSNNYQKPIYYFEDGLRKVYPFYYSYSAFCKGRWIGKEIIDIYCSELSIYPREEMVRRISCGIIRVNDKVVNPDYVLKNADLISSTVHRHELAVLACPIKILFENDELLAVDKPPSVPLHPCGLYYNNTVLSILANEYNKNDLYTLYRLDRLTSGVLLFAKSSEKSREIHRELNMRNIKKEYVCRVEGNFPDGTVVCNKPIKDFYRKVGACIQLVHPEGKDAITEFQKLSYNGNSSVVLCKPLTGRTHQIRVHLQYLGHPIINDPIYNSFVFGPLKGKNGITGKSLSKLIVDLCKEHTTQAHIEKTTVLKEISKESEHFLKFSIFKKYYHMNNKFPGSTKDFSNIVNDENCLFCKLPTRDPEQLSLGMFLHAYSYDCGIWRFESDMPIWANKDWNVV